MVLSIHIHHGSKKTKDAFPLNVKYKGETYVPTGKTGSDIKTGQPSKEYRLPDRRIWVLEDGTIRPD